MDESNRTHRIVSVVVDGVERTVAEGQVDVAAEVLIAGFLTGELCNQDNPGVRFVCPRLDPKKTDKTKLGYTHALWIAGSNWHSFEHWLVELDDTEFECLP